MVYRSTQTISVASTDCRISMVFFTSPWYVNVTPPLAMLCRARSRNVLMSVRNGFGSVTFLSMRVLLLGVRACLGGLHLYAASRQFGGSKPVRFQAKRLSARHRQPFHAPLNADSSAVSRGPSFGGLASSVGVTP